jgi:hypothetical protein
MDEMNVISKFLTGVISKITNKVLKKKLGYEINIKLNEVRANIIDGKTHIHLDIDAEMDKEELMKMIGKLI